MKKRWNGSLWKRPEPKPLTMQAWRKGVDEAIQNKLADPVIEAMVMDMPLMQTLRIKSSQLGYDDDGRL